MNSIISFLQNILGIKFMKKGLKPFSPKDYIITPTLVKCIYENRGVPGKTREQIQEEVSQKYGILVKDSPIVVSFQGNEILGLEGNFARIVLVDNRFVIIDDETPYKNIHAYDLNGNWIWDIESCMGWDGKPAYSFGQVSNIVVRDESNRDLLLTHAFPFTYATDLETGKGTRIWSIEDDTDAR